MMKESHVACLLSCRTEGTNIEAFSLHPGSIATNLSRHMGIFGSAMNLVLSWFSKSTEQVLLNTAPICCLLMHLACIRRTKQMCKQADLLFSQVTASTLVSTAL